MVMPLRTDQMGKSRLTHTPTPERELPAIGATVYRPPLPWERKKGELCPTSSKRNINYIGAWDLADSEAREPQTPLFPSSLFHKATCTLAETAVSAQANTTWVCLVQSGIAKLPGISSRMKRDNENARLKTELLTKNSRLPHWLPATLKWSLKDTLARVFYKSRQGHSSRNTDWEAVQHLRAALGSAGWIQYSDTQKQDFKLT